MTQSGFQKPADYQEPDALQVLYSAEILDGRLAALAGDIKATLGDEFLIVALLKGSFVFAADLVRALHQAGCSPQIDFMTLSSYGDAKESSGTLSLGQSVSDAVEGKPVLLVDDILESGRTMHFARELLIARGAGRVELCVLLDKPGKRKQALEAGFVGFTVPDRFVVGYGLDYAGYYRELPFIGVLD